MEKLMDRKTQKALKDYGVPIIFMVVIMVSMIITDQPFSMYGQEWLNGFLGTLLFTLALILPIQAGYGLNFGIFFGILATKIALVFILNFEWTGTFAGILLIVMASLLAMVLGGLTGILHSRIKKQELIVSYFMAVFGQQVYTLFFVYGAGSLVPMASHMLQDGTKGLLYGYDTSKILPLIGNHWQVKTTLVVLVVLAGLMVLRQFSTREAFKSWLNKNQMKSYVLVFGLSAVLAAWGQIVFTGSMGFLQTYSSPLYSTMTAVIAISLGGGHYGRTSLQQGLLGTLLLQGFILVTIPLFYKTANGNGAEVMKYVVLQGILLYSLVQGTQYRKNAL